MAKVDENKWETQGFKLGARVKQGGLTLPPLGSFESQVSARKTVQK